MKKSALFLYLMLSMLNATLAQGTWKQKTNFGGVIRMGAMAFSIGGKGYLGTGGNWLSAFYDDFWEYNPVSNAWTQKASYPGVPRYRAVGVATATKGYVISG